MAYDRLLWSVIAWGVICAVSDGYKKTRMNTCYLNSFVRYSSESDDTGRINRCLDSMQATRATTLVLNGQYTISAKIQRVISDLKIQGNFSTIFINIPDDGTRFDFAFLLRGNGTTTLQVSDLLVGHVLPSTRNDNEKSQLANFCATDFDCIQMDNVQSIRSHLAGIIVGNCNRGHMNLCKATSSRDRGIQLSGVQNFVVDQAAVNDCGIGYQKNKNIGYGITGSRLHEKDWDNNFNLTIQNSNVQNCSRKCIDIHNGNHVTIKKNIVKNYEWAGIHAVNQGTVKRVSEVKIVDNDITTELVTRDWGGGIVVGNTADSPMGNVKIAGNDMVNAHRFQQIVVHHTGSIDNLAIERNTIRSNTGYYKAKGIFVVESPKKIDSASVQSNTIDMLDQGACCVLNDIDRLHVPDNIMSTRGTKGVSYCLDVKNVKAMVESENTLDARMPGKQKRLQNVNEPNPINT